MFLGVAPAWAPVQDLAGASSSPLACELSTPLQTTMARLFLFIAALLGVSHAFTAPATSVRRSCVSAPAVSMAATLRTNDVVKVISGDDKGKVGKLLMVDLKKGKVTVEGINIKTKHVKPMKEGESGSLVKKEQPIHISNVAVTDEAPPAAEE